VAAGDVGEAVGCPEIAGGDGANDFSGSVDFFFCFSAAAAATEDD
jgi:hypothetical protein